MLCERFLKISLFNGGEHAHTFDFDIIVSEIMSFSKDLLIVEMTDCFENGNSTELDDCQFFCQLFGMFFYFFSLH